MNSLVWISFRSLATCLICVFGVFFQSPIAGFGQQIDPRILEIEKEQFGTNFQKAFPLIEQVLKEYHELSPVEIQRFGAIQMGFFTIQGDPERGLRLADSLEKLPNLASLPPASWASIHFQRGEIYSYLEKFLEASRSYEQAILLFDQQAKPNLDEVALCHNNLGYALDVLGFQNRSQASYYRAFEIWKSNNLEDFANISTVLNNLIFSEVEYGDFEAAEELLRFFDRYVQEAKKSFSLEPMAELDLEIKLLLNYSRYYGATKNNRLLDQNLTRAETLMRFAPRPFFEENWAIMASMYEEAGFLQKELKNFNAAIQYYERMKSLPLSGFYLMKYHANLAIVYYDAEQNQESLKYARKSLELFEQYGFGGSSGFSLKILQADLLHRLGMQSESIEMIEDMFSTLLDRRIKQEEVSNLVYADFDQLNNGRYLTILIKAGQIFRRIGNQSNSESDLRASFALFRVAAEMFQEYYLKGSYTQELDELNRQIEDGILLLWAESGLFSEEEKYQTLALLELNESQQGWKKFLSKNEEFLGSTSSILQELNLKALEINQGQNSELQEKNLQAELKQIEKRMEEEEAYRFFTGGNFDWKVFQNTLSQQETVIKYIVTDRQVYALLIQNSGIRLFSLASKDMINSWTEEFRTSLTKLDESYRVPAENLYKLLIGPFVHELTSIIQILPDDQLHALPFEALMDEKGEFLVQRFSFSYQQSFRQMAYQSPKNEKNASNFLVAFAPDYQGTGFQAIQNNLEEVESLSQALGGKVYSGSKATKRTFVESFTDYQVHHLAMHAEQQPGNFEESALIFAQGEKLLLRELYQMNFPSELVVLSACNTGMGQLMPGEGLMSLSKALSLAGVKSTVYSLWEVPDRETSDLMVNFYEEIKRGKSKDEALSLAKRKFLETNPLKKHPIFWAGFVLNGKTEPLNAPWVTNRLLLILGLGTAMVLLAGAWVFRSRKSNT